jgi:hypothetical protein
VRETPVFTPEASVFLSPLFEVEPFDSSNLKLAFSSRLSLRSPPLEPTHRSNPKLTTTTFYFPEVGDTGHP